MTETQSMVVYKHIVVGAPIARAFIVFTERFGDFKPQRRRARGSDQVQPQSQVDWVNQVAAEEHHRGLAQPTVGLVQALHRDVGARLHCRGRRVRMEPEMPAPGLVY